ncbi:MAG: branched-chain amino acid ABC transporter permease [Proteobacteria bacterium]|nr:branched-chain amino acid ABC transporter permease [Pseudomonadota bacterium]
MSWQRILAPIALAVLALLPFLLPDYFLHLAVQILIWGFVYTSWSLMGRFGLVSLGHGAFFGIGAYGAALFWNLLDLSPWLGILISVAAAVLLAFVVAYPATRMRVLGHYYALVTLALSQVVLLSITALRGITGGSLGMTQRVVGRSWYALQFPQQGEFYLLALGLWLVGLAAWIWVDRGMGSKALEAINEDEGAAAAIGINVMREKLRITLLSAALTALGGGIYAQYIMYVNPETVSGVGISLQIVFAAIAGGMYSLLGPTVGSLFTLALTEGLRVLFGTNFIGAANTIYGVLLILFIVFMPRGIVGLVEHLATRRQRVAPQPGD